jgi:DNA-binding transcriptional MerR regulator
VPKICLDVDCEDPEAVEWIEDHRIVTSGDAAEMLQVSESTVRTYADDGRLPCRVTKGGHRRFLLKDVLRVAESLKWWTQEKNDITTSASEDAAQAYSSRKKNGTMFDADYFTKHILTQIDELGGSGSTTVTVRLGNGHEYRVQSIGAAHPGYVLLSVYPPEGREKKHREKRKKKPDHKIFYDRVAISYGMITEVFLTIVDPDDDEGAPFGFRPAP